MDSLTTFALEVLAYLWEFSKVFFASPLFLGLAASAAGAFGGAIGAQRISEKKRRKEALISELRNTNAAIMMAFSIANSLLMLKKQHIKPLCEKFNSDERALMQALAQHKQNPQNQIKFEFTADLQTFPAPSFSIETLKHILYEKISTSGRPLSAVYMLEQSCTGLLSAIRQRELLIEAFKTGSHSQDEFICRYFGVKDNTGHVYREYKDLIHAIGSYLDDVLFFSEVLCQDLQSHGKRVTEKLRKEDKRLKVPAVNSPDFTKSRNAGLMPDDVHHSDWLRSFEFITND